MHTIGTKAARKIKQFHIRDMRDVPEPIGAFDRRNHLNAASADAKSIILLLLLLLSEADRLQSCFVRIKCTKQKKKQNSKKQKHQRHSALA